ncbi:MAG: hypothetical protein ABIE42_02505 [Candidatus Eisenbacteria bacterium]
MRQTLLLLMLAVFVTGVTGTTFAETDDDAVTAVFVRVLPTMVVEPGASFFDMGRVGVGEIRGYMPFVVDSNVQTVAFMASASLLFKGADAVDPEVPPIDLLADAGVSFSIADGGPTGGHDNIAAFTDLCDVNGFPGLETEWVEFESSQNNRFSQGVIMEVTWIQDDPEKPRGEYTGFVELFAMVTEEGLPTR